MLEYHEIEAKIDEINKTANTPLATTRLGWTLGAEGPEAVSPHTVNKLASVEGFRGIDVHEGKIRFYFEVGHPYGEALVGFWSCPSCSTERFPNQLRSESSNYPYKCPKCGELMQYDEAA